MKRSPVFVPEQFELAPTIKAAELDQEVASIVANEIYDANNRLKYPNNHTGRGDAVTVHVEMTGDSYGSGHAEAAELPSGFHIYSSHKTTDLQFPEVFGKEMQRALDTDERSNRLSVGWTLAAAVVMPGAFYGFAGYAAEQAISSHNPSLLAPGAIAAAYGTVVAGVPEAHSIFRRTITNPNLNRPHLSLAARRIAKLGLPPVVNFYPKPQLQVVK